MKIVVTKGQDSKEIDKDVIVRIFDKAEIRYKRIRAEFLKIGESIYKKNNSYWGYCVNNDFADAQSRKEYEENSHDFYALNS